MTDSAERDANHANESAEGACTLAHRSSNNDLSPTGAAWKAFVAPAVGTFRPRLASVWLTAAPTSASSASCLLWLLLLGASVVTLLMWDATAAWRTRTPIGMSEVLQMATANSRFTRGDDDYGNDLLVSHAFERSMVEVWRDWHANGVFSVAESAFLLVVGIALLLALLAAWVFLPDAYRGGPVGRCWLAVFRAVASCDGLLNVLTVALITFALAAHRGHLPESAGLGDWMPVVVVLLFASLSLMIFCISRAVDAINMPPPSEPAPPPRCEHCGYDLTHRPADGRCSECGLRIELSLTPGAIRRERNWEQIGGNLFALDRVSAILLRPSEFYRTALIRTSDDDGRRFARRLYILIGVCAAVWIFSMFMLFGPNRDINQAFVLSAIMLFIVPLMGWFVQRVVAAIVISWWAYKNLLDDFRWARRVIGYETAYLWVFCLFNGVAISVVAMGRTPAWARGMAYFGIVWLPIGFGLFLLGNLALIALWFWRYRLAGRAIRWNNF